MDRIEADVCVVGAGYAGLAAARRLTAAGASTVVLEARDRVGGRVWTRRDDDTGAPLDIGGTWLGSGQDAAYALAKEVNVSTYPTYAGGDTVFIGKDGGAGRSKGVVPRLNPIVLASLGQGMLRLDAMARSLSIDQPWASRHARSWDSKTSGGWIDSQVPTKSAKHLLRASVRGLMTADPSEVSLLHFLYLIRSAGGLNKLLSVEGGYQQDRIEGGAQAIADRVAAELGEAVQLAQPVERIVQDGGGVQVIARNIIVHATRAVVAIPPALASRLRYEPALPVDRAELIERMPAGSILKVLAVYEESFWRRDGLNGQSVAMNSPIETTLDASPSSGTPGVLAAFAFGPGARLLARRRPEERRRIVLDELRAAFGSKAGEPISYVEHDWAQEEWSRGCFLSHLAPGVLTQYGHALRPPVGRIHWAGTETATISHGTIDGAIRSGQRAASEVLAAL
jgi:monoamine oxidase